MRRRATARAIGCSEADSTAPARRRISVRDAPSSGVTSTSSILPSVTVPVLSRTIVPIRRVCSRTSGPLTRIPSCAPRPVPTIIAVGVARPSAHGHAMMRTATAAVNASAAERAEREPADERGERDRDHDRDEDRRDAVGQPLHRRLPRLRGLDEARDLGERRVRADLRRADDEPAVGVDRRAGDVGAGLDLDGQRLARQQRLVDGRRALHDDPVGRDLLARPHDEQVADMHVLDGDETSAPSRRTRASLAPSSSSARIASSERRFARASR